MIPGQLEVTIEKLVYGGYGLSRTDGRVLLTPFVLPGEVAVVEPADKLHTALVHVEQPSPERRFAPCPYFGTCGGCHYQQAPYPYQLEQKREILREVIRRVGKFEAPSDIPVVCAHQWHYRNRTQLHVQDGKIGYLRMGSHDLCAVTECPISSLRLNEAIAALGRMVKDRRFPSFIRTVELFTNEEQVQFNVIESDRPVARHFFEWCAFDIPGYAPGAIDYEAAGVRFRVGPRSFFQVNRFLIDKLVEAAIGDARGKLALDLYAGVGLFSIPLKTRFAEVNAVETGASAVADLRTNTERAGVSLHVHRHSVDEYLASVNATPDFILADPPREGLGKHVVSELIRLKAPRLHIVACDPSTLARDLSPLLASGYRLDRMILVDLFPQTYHLETVVHLSRT
jgi:23S rRNA (uracil1939-C5)-methyltransferase